MMIRLMTVAACVLVGGLALTAQAPSAQGGGRGAAPATGPSNLQVLPRDFTNAQVVQVMQTFTQALGVTCAHCHVFVAPGSPMNNMASDMKPQKNIARAMMRMAADVNATLGTVISKPDDQRTRVQCLTCHRGSAIPVATAPAVPAARGAAPQG